MDLQIAGKVALVTGGSKGIGFAVAKGLLEEGAKVVLSARNEATLDKALSELRVISPDVAAISADVSSESSIKALFTQTKTLYGDPEILLVNGGGPPAGTAENIPEDAWAKGYDLTLMSAVRLARAALPAMKAAHWGRIINITSISVKAPVANLTLSNALRAAVTGFAKTLSTELAGHNITVNNVGPGYTATARLQELFPNEGDDAELLKSIPAKRFGTPEEVASAAIYLASKQAAYITGQTIMVDGGVINATY